MFKRSLLTLFFISSTSFAQTMTQENIKQGTAVDDPTKYPYEELVLDRIIYEEDAYSNSKKTQLGDNVELEMGLRYQKDANSFARFRFETDPQENRSDNETSKFEIIYNRYFKRFLFQVDLELQTNDRSEGGTTLGLDLDSDDTFISYDTSKNTQVTFYLFNFRSDVGDEFNTKDVTRISYIEGSPTSVLATPTNDEKFVTKTIPGFELKYKVKRGYFYTGIGIASYLYPTNDDFDIESNPSATAWERKEVTAYKLGYIYNLSHKERLAIQYVNHNNSDETGALLSSAGSLTYYKRVNTFSLKAEFTQTTAGTKPYQLSRTSNWIEDVTLNRPVYSDINGDKQDWVGQTDSAYALKLGYNLTSSTPYLFYKYQGEHFIFRDKESAHRLRNDDESLSHGGLTRVGLGSYFYYENLFFNPELEWQQAKNPVFSNSTDVSNDRLQSSFKKENILFSLRVVFAYDGSNLDQSWWF
ncbi:MAG: hypothetical protein QF441_15675 [Bacteriovoracaceae bacterium]|jgi:hypothetical protein|nr:hypothetical protein [Bacteriovoracaceae bacterium]